MSDLEEVKRLLGEIKGNVSWLAIKHSQEPHRLKIERDIRAARALLENMEEGEADYCPKCGVSSFAHCPWCGKKAEPWEHPADEPNIERLAEVVFNAYQDRFFDEWPAPCQVQETVPNWCYLESDEKYDWTTFTRAILKALGHEGDVPTDEEPKVDVFWVCPNCGNIFDRQTDRTKVPFCLDCGNKAVLDEREEPEKKEEK